MNSAGNHTNIVNVAVMNIRLINPEGEKIERLIMRDTEKAIEALKKTKNDAASFYKEAVEDVERWGEVISDCDAEIAAIQEEKRKSPYRRLLLLIIAVNLIVLASIILTGCTTAIRGTGEMISGIGQGGGTIVKGVGDYLIEEMEGK